ncbi:hypothetical protein NQ317_011047 [Molorchus minor]|uniref:Uncharacterized protein n=1 Tax=Molorchus minor TaxID=1323400 RepID=A0ABQ9J663_9CUCU|nr:hypothetical protein NQ317_011047 [Molorchus minor]
MAKANFRCVAVWKVVDDVVYLELYKSQTNTGQVKSINEVMLEQGYAEPSTESYLSRADHEKRMRVANAENSILEAARLSKEKMVNYDDFDAPVVKENYKIIQLRGPFSPLEIKLHGSIESSLNKSVDIDGSSVNTVLLDTELQNYHTRLLVAGYVGQTMNGARLRLRQTTMLPNIPGLPMLLSLLFCPTMRVKLSNDGTRVASILCGLGYNEYTDKAYYQAHDLSLVLDTELTEDEVNKINQIRFYMNQGVKLMYDLSQEMVGQQEMIRTQNSLKKELIELIRMPRRQVERINVKFANVWWKNNIDAVILKPSTCDDAEFIWPLLWFVKLNNIKNYSPNVSKNLDDLDQIARNMTPVPPNMMCELCREPVFDVYEVREHLVSNSHKEAFKRI